MGRKSKVDVRKQEILQYFYEVMKKEGFEGASIAKIAVEMEVNPSLLIHYFKTKEEMVVELVDFLLKQYEAAFLTDFDQVADPAQRLEKTLGILFSPDWLQVGDHSVFYACYYLASRHERILERFQLMYRRLKELLTKEAAVWIEAGLIELTSPEQTAEYLIMLNEGLNYYQHIFAAEDYRQRVTSMRALAEKTLGKK